MFIPRLVKTQTSPQNNIDKIPDKSFFQEIVEGLDDGILIVSESGKIIHSNSNAQKICTNLASNDGKSQNILLSISQLCESLLESKQLFSFDNFIISDEVNVDKHHKIRIRVRWLNLDQILSPCMLVTMEDRTEYLRNIVTNEAKKYELTTREAEVWFLYRNNYSYKEISEQLYITINTVKKHMKNINAKRYPFLDVA